MKIRTLLHCCIVALFCACGGEDLVPNEQPKKECVEWQIVRASKDPVQLKVWLDPEQHLAEGFVLTSLNSYWNEVGMSVVRAKSADMANIGLVYASGGCRRPIMVGHLQIAGWDKLRSIIVDYNCFDSKGYNDKFPAAVSHALGNLMGIEAYPDFCGEGGVMSESVGAMKFDVAPKNLSSGDKEAFSRRSQFVAKWERTTVCRQEPKWEEGEYSPPDSREVKFWTDPALSAVPIQSYLNKYFRLFGRSFVSVAENEAEFVVKSWPDEYISCSPMAVTYNSLREIQLKPERGCLKLTPDSEWDATIVTHEVAHLFGVSHVPDWCGNAIMDPYVNAGPYFTPADVKAWQARDLTWSVLDSRVLRMRSVGQVAFVPLGIRGAERKFRSIP